MEASCAAAAAALPALCSALAAHSQDAAVVEPICRALRNISAVEPLKVVSTEAAIPAAIAALQAHAGVEALLIVACSVLFNSASSSEGCKKCMAAGAVPAVAALAAHASQAVQVEACSVLGRLAPCLGQDAGAEGSTAQAVVGMLKAHDAGVELAAECCTTLHKMSRNAAGRAACLAAGAAPALVRALQAADSRVAEAAVMALLAITVSSPGQAIHGAVAARGDFPALIAAWRRATAP